MFFLFFCLNRLSSTCHQLRRLLLPGSCSNFHVLLCCTTIITGFCVLSFVFISSTTGLNADRTAHERRLSCETRTRRLTIMCTSTGELKRATVWPSVRNVAFVISCRRLSGSMCVRSVARDGNQIRGRLLLAAYAGATMGGLRVNQATPWGRTKKSLRDVSRRRVL